MANILWFLWHTFRLQVQGIWQSSVLQSICSCCCAAKDGRNVCDAKASSATIYGQDGKEEGQGEWERRREVAWRQLKLKNCNNCKLVCSDYMTQNQSLTFVNCVQDIFGNLPLLLLLLHCRETGPPFVVVVCQLIVNVYWLITTLKFAFAAYFTSHNNNENNEWMKYNKNGLIASITMDTDMSTLCAIKGQFNAQTHGP